MDAESAAQTPLIIVLTVAAMASISLNIGKAVQKMKVEVLRQGKKVMTAPYRRDFLIWVIGISLTFVAGVLTMFAQKMTDKTSIVSSMNGVGLIALTIFAWLVLRERVGVRELLSMTLIVCGTIAVSYFNKTVSSENYYNFKAVMICIGATLAFFAIAIPVALKLKKGLAFIFAAFAGCNLAMMNIFYHIAPMAGADESLGSLLLTPYFIIGFLILGNLGFLFTNLAFFHGTGITVVPTVNSFLMIMPMVYEVPIFKNVLVLPQYMGALIIVVGVIILTTAPGHNVAKGEKSDKMTAEAVS